MHRHGNIFAALFLVWFFIQSQRTHAQTGTRDYYTAAVVEYATVFDEAKSPLDNILSNIEPYVDNIKTAKQKDADIIVFPECGLTSVHLPTEPSEAQVFTAILPDPKDKTVPCNSNGTWTNVLQRISCAAKENSIYVVINLPERARKSKNSDDFYLYNTNIVFDRNGAVIARYRKYNLFGEPAFNRTDTPELVTFDTDFGVTFGTFICFDILFAEPAMQLIREKKVTNFVYPTAWFSELPFLSAVQVQAGWARANGVNLLAAGYDDPKKYSGGSGIYSGASGIVDYLIPVSKNTQLLVARVNITNNNKYNDVIKPINPVQSRSNDYLHTLQENFTGYHLEELTGNVTDKQVCHNKLCCKFTAKFKQQPPNNIKYMMTVYRGWRSFGVESNTVEICGIVGCVNATREGCGVRIDRTAGSAEFSELRITGEFEKEDEYIHFPSIASYGLYPLSYSKYIYKAETQRYEISGLISVHMLRLKHQQVEFTACGLFSIDNSLLYAANKTNKLMNKIRYSNACTDDISAMIPVHVIRLKHQQVTFTACRLFPIDNTLLYGHIHCTTELALLGTLNIAAPLDSAYRQNIIKHNETVDQNRYILKRIINSIKFCGKLELALRGHDELIDFTSELDSIMKEHLESATVFKGTPKTVQNEILNSMLEVCRQEIAEQINKVDFLAIQCDETTDISNHCQMVMIFRYVYDCNIFERFWCFSRITDNGLTEYIEKELESIIKNKPHKLIAQTYDGANVMGGKLGSVQRKIKEKYKNAHFVHCYAHQLNLIVQKVASVNAKIKVFFSNLSAIPNFFSSSTHRCDVFEEIVKIKMARVDPMLWNYNIRTVNAVFENHAKLIECLEELEEKCNKTITSKEAYGLRKALEDPYFDFWLNLFHTIFPHVDTLFNQFHSRYEDSVQLLKDIEVFEKTILLIRDSRYDIQRAVENKHGVNLNKRRKDGESRIDVIAKEVCDTIIVQMKERFSYRGHLEAASLLNSENFLSYSIHFPKLTLNSVVECYPVLDKEKLKTELEVIYLREDFRNIVGGMNMLSLMTQNNLEETYSRGQRRKLVFLKRDIIILILQLLLAVSVYYSAFIFFSIFDEDAIVDKIAFLFQNIANCLGLLANMIIFHVYRKDIVEILSKADEIDQQPTNQYISTIEDETLLASGRQLKELAILLHKIVNIHGIENDTVNE
ncbi:uncharacterized protein CBL_08811 [Carabus blaptoides fortunei]